MTFNQSKIFSLWPDPSNPPIDPHTEGVCSMRWSEERDPSTNHLLYHLANFTSKEESEANGFTVTHAGHCGACSSLQDLGVYIRQNLTVVISFPSYVIHTYTACPTRTTPGCAASLAPSPPP